MIVVIITCVEILVLTPGAGLPNVSIACTWICESLTAVRRPHMLQGKKMGIPCLAPYLAVNIALGMWTVSKQLTLLVSSGPFDVQTPGLKK